MKSQITTHVLNTAKGIPASNVKVRLMRLVGDAWEEIASGATDGDGRIMSWFEKSDFKLGHYQIIFNTKAYLGDQSFFPEVKIDFKVDSTDEHYHVPLLLSPFGYSTYRGS